METSPARPLYSPETNRLQRMHFWRLHRLRSQIDLVRRPEPTTATIDPVTAEMTMETKMGSQTIRTGPMRMAPMLGTRPYMDGLGVRVTFGVVGVETYLKYMSQL